MQSIMCVLFVSYTMSRLAAWSILTGTSFVDVLDSMVATHPDDLDLYLQTADG